MTPVGVARGGTAMGTRQARSWLTRIGTVAVIGALALGAGNPALARAQEPGDRPPQEPRS